MSGVRQHFLSQVLLNGFASRTSDTEAHAWLFRVGRIPSEPNIKKIAVEKYFYSDGANLDVDEAISGLESALGTSLDDLRQQPSSVRITNVKIIDFITNLLIRTRALRTRMFTSVDFIFDFLTNRLRADPKLLSRMAREQAENQLLQEAARQGIHLNTHQKQILLTKLEEKIDAEAVKLAPVFAEAIRNFRPRIASLVKTSHIQALAKNPVPSLRGEALKELNWSLFIFDDDSLILGDIGPLSKSLKSGLFEYLPTADNTGSIILPISHNRAIVGCSSTAAVHLDSEAINQASAVFSSEFLVSNRNSNKEQRYLKALGTQSMALTTDEMAKILEELF